MNLNTQHLTRNSNFKQTFEVNINEAFKWMNYILWFII
jgi:hypothetical protein